MLVGNLINLLIITLIIIAFYLIVTGKITGNMKTITIVFIVIIIIYLLLNSSLFSNESSLIDNISDASGMTIIKADSLKGYESNCSYCAWIYIDDWNYKYGEKKRILARRDNTTEETIGFNPEIYLSELQNDLNIVIDCYDSNTEGSIPHKCVIENINLQKWVCIITVLNSRSLDVYLNGKLAKTCVLPGVPRVNNSSDIYITPGDNLSTDATCGAPPHGDNLCGFGGFTGITKFYPEAKNPQQAWDIYRKGPGISILGNLLNKYHMKFVFSSGKDSSSEFSLF